MGDGNTASKAATGTEVVALERLPEFVLASGAKNGHSCSVKIVEDIRQHADEKGSTEAGALKEDMGLKLMGCIGRGWGSKA